MSKQIKIGFDKASSPVTSQFHQLVDIEGNLLFDEAGNPLLTEEEASLASFTRAENSTSLHLNNANTDPEIVPISEVFPEQSSVSTNLLGYNRAEVQLSLFSDVSTYGVDVNNWEYYTFNGGIQFPIQWYRKKNSIYGNRNQPSFDEETNEQALVLKSFPVQYTYPFGRSWARDDQDQSRYNEDLFIQYLNFIAMGKFLYQEFINTNSVFANKNLITPKINIIPDWNNNPEIFQEKIIPQYRSTIDLYGIRSMPSAEVNYGDNLQEAFDEIERWTFFWEQIVNGIARFPLNMNNAIVDFTRDARYINDIVPFARTATRPGYSDTRESFAILESKNSFRYQPGRISGFTFGTRLKTNAASLNNYIEWGVANDTDQYIFQLRGSQFNIIRRSVIAMPRSLLDRQGIPDSAVNNQYFSIILNNSQAMQQVIISRDNWNGDQLNGSGPSGYTLQFENVTMYKIEFSWYGAIGAKFYAYVPVENGEARWVRMHTLIIENGMGAPILKNPEFKFRYVVYSERTSSINEPFFIYKYGSSYYIDGGDEGTVRIATENSDTKTFSNRTSLIGVLPKANIISSFQNQEVINQKKILPINVNVNSTVPARIDVEEITGSRDGFHYHYSPSLSKSRIGTTANIVFDSTGRKISQANNLPIPENWNQAKVIADGIYNVYLDSDGNVLRRSRDSQFDFVLRNRPISDRVELLDGTQFNPRNQEVEARISEYTYAASSIPINAEKFKIHFLNPLAHDREFRNKHFSDFMFSFVSEAPSLNSEGELIFGSTGTFKMEDSLFVEWSNQEERSNSQGLEDTEWEFLFGTRLETDARANNESPQGEDTGRISAIICEIETFVIEVETITPGLGEFDGLWKIVFRSSTAVPQQLIRDSFGTGEIGINGESTGIIIEGPIGVENDPERVFVYVNGNPGSNVDAIQLRSLLIRSAWIPDFVDSDGESLFRIHNWFYNRAFSFGILPLYLVVGMKDNAKINNIIVEEINNENSVTHTPSWITSSNSGISVVNSGGASQNESPSNFQSRTRLQGSLFDIQTTQPMRPGNVIYSFYVDANEQQTIDLSKIFNFDRKQLSAGIYNNRAVYFTASQLEPGDGNIEISLTVKEQ